MKKFNIVYKRNVPVIKDGKELYRRTCKREWTVGATGIAGALLKIYDLEYQQYPDVKIELLAAYVASARGWQPIQT